MKLFLILGLMRELQTLSGGDSGRFQCVLHSHSSLSLKVLKDAKIP